MGCRFKKPKILRDLNRPWCKSARSPRIGDARFPETLRAQDAAVAAAARRAVRQRIVTAVRQAVIEAELDAARDDLRLAERDERRVDANPFAFDSGPSGERRQPLERDRKSTRL